MSIATICGKMCLQELLSPCNWRTNIAYNGVPEQGELCKEVAFLRDAKRQEMGTVDTLV